MTANEHGVPAPPQRLAVIGPTFFSYTQAISGEFARRGVEIVEFDEKSSNRKRSKIAFRLGLGLGAGSGQARYLQKIAGEIIAAEIGDVLLVGVEVVDRATVARLTRAGVRVHLYMWDGSANKGRFRDYLELLTSASTFDVRDADDLGMAYVPLFSESMFEDAGGDAEPVHDLGFCGTLHSSRTAILARLVAAPWARKLRLGLQLYYHSRLLFLAKSLMQPAGLRLLPRVAERPFAKEAVARLSRESRYVLDIPHPGQTGLTARTFEALQAGARLITFNRAATTLLPSGLAARIVPVDHVDDIARVDFALARPGPLSAEDRYYLSLERFVDQLLVQFTKRAGDK